MLMWWTLLFSGQWDLRVVTKNIHYIKKQKYFNSNSEEIKNNNDNFKNYFSVLIYYKRKEYSFTSTFFMGFCLFVCF